MAKQTINLGTLANDGTGDTHRASFDKCNDNFDELYALTDGTGAASVLTLAAGSTTLGDTTISDATPILIFKDSSCTDADNNATILVAATATGSNAENIDVTLTQQIGGAATNWLVSDADGSITLGDASRGIVLSGAVTSGDMTISDATPVINFKDSSCAVSDVNAYIEAVATDTGDGSEDVDVYIYQQVNGSPFACFYANADGAVVIGYNGQPTIMSNASRVQSTAPVFKLLDTDAVDGDEGVSFAAACTTVTAGAENVDLTITQQVGGSPANVLVADADGSITLGDGTRAVYVPKLKSWVPVIANTGAATPASTDSGTVYTNEGDANGSSVTLPTAVAGLRFTFYVQVAQTLTITAGADDTIRVGTNATAAAGSITCATVGSSLTLVAINATEWVAIASVGTWSFA